MRALTTQQRRERSTGYCCIPVPCSVRPDYFFFLEGVCAKALPAAVLDALPVLPSRKTCEAADAARGEVCFLFAGIVIVICTVFLFRGVIVSDLWKGTDGKAA